MKGIKTVTVVGLQMFRKITDHAVPGDLVGILLRGVVAEINSWKNTLF